MRNGRCRIHGGKATGARKGNRNGEPGNYSTQAKVLRLGKAAYTIGLDDRAVPMY